ncbi:MAG TPA: DUF4190 domain-containing protein, partial [Tepidisphaeraceae bacterium]|nr:DUF4190 domain-containing protein [Tepidisphaeraceae bacterium]
MSQPNNPHPPQHVPYGQTNVYITPQPTNGLGIAGFITSLVGLVSCGILSPIGFLLSLFGMFKRPRGFAIAGVVLGALGSFFMVFFGLAIVAGLVGLGAAGKAIGEEFTTMSNAVQASAMIEDSKKENGFLPSDKDGTALISGKQDAWQNSFRYKKTGTETYKIISAGNDGIF